MSQTIESPPRSFQETGTRGPSAPIETTTPMTEQFVVTRNVVTGDIVSIETLDSSGRAAISDEAARKIVGNDEFEELEGALNEAFDGGVTMVLDDSDDDEGDADADDYRHAALLRALAIATAGRRAMRRLATARRNLLGKLILRRLVRRYFLRRRLAAS